MDNRTLAKLENDLNKFILNKFPELLPRSPNMRYWKSKKNPYAFAWTTEPVQGKFYACVYRILKNGTWKLKRKVGFTRRKIAKARAKKWFDQHQKKYTLA